MFSLNMFGFYSLSIFSVLCLLVILNIFNFLKVFTFFASLALVLWLSWLLISFWRNILPKHLVSISGKTILITGCDSGFGLLTAQTLHKKGFNVLASCLSDKSDGYNLLTKMNIKIIEMNVTNEEQIKSSRINVENYLKESNTELWALVNNAGLLTLGCIEWGDITDLKRVLDVNVIGLALVTRHFLPLIRKSRGRVINIASCAGRYTVPYLGFYSMSKHAVIAFSDALRREMLEWGVKVSTIEPAIYRTPMGDEDRVVCSLLDVWQRTSQKVKSDYGENLFYAIKEIVSGICRRARHQTNEVIDSIMDAVMNVSPRVRYTCCDQTFGIFWWLMETLPNQLLDQMFRFYNIFLVKPRALDNGFN